MNRKRTFRQPLSQWKLPRAIFIATRTSQQPNHYSISKPFRSCLFPASHLEGCIVAVYYSDFIFSNKFLELTSL
ncbi:hypothetical protein ABEB36_008652 [Hypothenemus hampei]|uniref:Uncharacterized protein n=1 Tax=Hypothenemus hampei TaxID=57062 RepID=A0ABD1EMP5_HYPHA